MARSFKNFYRKQTQTLFYFTAFDSATTVRDAHVRYSWSKWSSGRDCRLLREYASCAARKTQPRVALADFSVYAEADDYPIRHIRYIARSLRKTIMSTHQHETAFAK